MEATVSTRSVTDSNVLNISDPGRKENSISNTIQFKVSYPKNYRGQRFWRDGDIIDTSIESAIDFEKRNLGKIVKDEVSKSVKDETGEPQQDDPGETQEDEIIEPVKKRKYKKTSKQ